MNVPFMDLKLQFESIRSEIYSAIDDVFSNSSFILGPHVIDFEGRFAGYCGKNFAVGLNSGTAALQLALIANGVTFGEEVILPVNTYIATAYSVHHVGATPVFVDIDEDTYNIDVGQIRDRITDKTRAIIPVHLYGQPASMGIIEQIAMENDLKIIEDACQAHGASYNGTRVPVTSTGCFSFYPAKILGACGDAGMVVTDDEITFKMVKTLRDQGQETKSVHNLIGFNERMDEIQGAILGVKLNYLDKWIEERRRIATLYDQSLEGIVKIPYRDKASNHAFHLYVIRVEERDALSNFLKERGVGSLVHYPAPIHMQNAFKHLGYSEGDFPVAEKVSKEILSLPMYPELKDEQVDYVCELIKQFYGAKKKSNIL